MSKLVMTYLGAQRMPVDPTGGAFSGSIGPLAYDPVTGNLLVMGNVVQQTACIVKPHTWWKITNNRDVTALNRAAVVTGWHDPSVGLRSALAAEVPTINQWRTCGTTYHGGKLYLIVYRYYNVTNTSYRGLAVVENGIRKGAWKIGNFHSLATNFYLAADSAGGLFCGSSFAYISSSQGPSVHKIGPIDEMLLDGEQQPAARLLWYTTADPFAWTGPQDHPAKTSPTDTAPLFHYLPAGSPRPSKVWNGSWTCNSNAVVDASDGTKSLVYAVSRPYGDWYGGAPFTDPTGEATLLPMQGNPQGYNRESQSTCLRVFPEAITSGGTDKSSYEIPIRHKLIRDYAECLLTADHAGRRLFVLESRGDWQNEGPILHCWKY